MTDFVDDDHAKAVLDRLRANLALTVYDGVVPNPYPAPPYVLVYSDIAWPSSPEATGASFNFDSLTCVATFTVHNVGLTAAACRALSMQVRASLLDVVPVVAGRSCTPISLEDSQVPIKDETTGKPVIDAVVTYSFTSVPA